MQMLKDKPALGIYHQADFMHEVLLSWLIIVSTVINWPGDYSDPEFLMKCAAGWSLLHFHVARHTIIFSLRPSCSPRFLRDWPFSFRTRRFWRWGPPQSSAII